MRPSVNGQAARVMGKAAAEREDSPWYRLEDMCRLFDVGERCIWQWVANGQLPKPRKKGRRWSRWPKDEIDELLRRWGK